MTAILPQLADVFVNFPQCEHRNGYIDSLLGRIELAGVDIDKSPCAALERITLQFLGIDPGAGGSGRNRKAWSGLFPASAACLKVHRARWPPRATLRKSRPCPSGAGVSSTYPTCPPQHLCSVCPPWHTTKFTALATAFPKRGGPSRPAGLPERVCRPRGCRRGIDPPDDACTACRCPCAATWGENPASAAS